MAAGLIGIALNAAICGSIMNTYQWLGDRVIRLLPLAVLLLELPYKRPALSINWPAWQIVKIILSYFTPAFGTIAHSAGIKGQMAKRKVCISCGYRKL
jgi:hypothetical protein